MRDVLIYYIVMHQINYRFFLRQLSTLYLRHPSARYSHRPSVIWQAAFVLILLALSISNANAGWLDRLKELKQQYSESSSSSNDAGADISEGLKEALKVGSQKSIGVLSKRDGYFKDPKVHIPLPSQLDRFASLMERIGQKEQVSEFVMTLNRAAEKSVAVTGDIFLNAIKKMTIVDAVNIYRGGDDEATRYFRRTAGPELFKAIRPIVADSTTKVGVTHQYKRLRSKGGNFGRLLTKNTPDLDTYITEKTIDGLFVKIAEQEAEIRHNPKARTTDLLRKVFGRK